MVATPSNTPSPGAGKLLAIPLVLLYGVSLLWAYENFIAQDFSYLGYSYREPSPLGVGLGYSLCAVLALSMPRKIQRPGDFILWVMFVIATVPSLLLPHVIEVLDRNVAIEASLVIAASWLLAVFIGTRETSSFFPMISVSSGLAWLIIALTCLALYGVLLSTTGLRVEFLRLDAVLDTRLDYRDALSRSSPLAAYGILLLGNVMNPLLIATGTLRRNLPLIGAGAFGQLLIYSVTGYKTMILSTIAVFAVALLTRRSRVLAGWSMVAVVAALCATAASVDQLLTDGLLTQVFVNRMLATPGVLTAAHLWVFSDIGFVYWSNSIMEPFIEYPFSRPPSFMVGYLFSGSEITSANANIFADGYMNFGYPGVVLESALLGALVFAVNSAARKVHLGWACAILVVPSFALSNTGILTAMLTHGFAAVLILFASLGDLSRADSSGAGAEPTVQGPADRDPSNT